MHWSTIGLYIGRLSVDCRLTVGRLLVDCRPIVGRLPTDSRPIVDPCERWHPGNKAKRIEEKYKAIVLGKTIEDGAEEHIDHIGRKSR